MQDEDLDVSPVEIDDALVIEDDDITDEDEDDHDDVCDGKFLVYRQNNFVMAH